MRTRIGAYRHVIFVFIPAPPARAAPALSDAAAAADAHTSAYVSIRQHTSAYAPALSDAAAAADAADATAPAQAPTCYKFSLIEV